MRALLDGVFEAEEGFEEVENDEEFEDKEGDFILTSDIIPSTRLTECREYGRRVCLGLHEHG